MLPRLSLQQSASIAEIWRNGRKQSSFVDQSSHAKRILASIRGISSYPVETLEPKFEYVQSQSGDVINVYVDQWDIRLIGYSAADTSILDAKIEEIYWAHVLFYGVGGWNEEKGFLANFVK